MSCNCKADNRIKKINKLFGKDYSKKYNQKGTIFYLLKMYETIEEISIKILGVFFILLVSPLLILYIIMTYLINDGTVKVKVPKAIKEKMLNDV